MGGMIICITTFVNLKRFIEEHCIVGLCSMEGGGLTHKHFQVVKGDFSSLLALNKKSKICLGWVVNSPSGHVVLCKKLRDEG